MASYGTYADGDTYFATRLWVSAWTGATDANKTIALAEATTRIDQLRFYGEKTDDDQDNEFPRDDDDTPDEIAYACFEIAMELLDGRNPDLEFENLSIKTYRFDKVSTERSEAMPEHILAGIPSVVAWRYLKPYLASNRTLRISRVS